MTSRLRRTALLVGTVLLALTGTAFTATAANADGARIVGWYELNQGGWDSYVMDGQSYADGSTGWACMLKDVP
jgi:hypothetical protein